MFAPTTQKVLPASHAAAHDYDPHQEEQPEFPVSKEDKTAAAIEGSSE